MFRPVTATVSHERVSVSDLEGWSFQNTGAQDIRDSALRLVPLTGSLLPQDLAWPKVTWSQEDALPYFPGSISERWDSDFNNQTVSTPQTFEFEPLSTFLDIDTEAGEKQVMRQWTGAPETTQKFWPLNVSNSRGWTIQTRVQVIEDETGLPANEGHYLHIDDGEYQERIYFHETGMYFQSNPQLNVQADFRSRPRELRIAALQDDIYVLLDDGRGYANFDGYTSNSDGSPYLAFGTTGSAGHYQTLWDYLHVYTDGVVIDESPEIGIVYSTEPVYAYTPTHSPKLPVDRWVSATFETSGDLTGGTTNITIEYKSSVTGDWIEFDTVTVSVIGWMILELDDVPTAEDGTDEIRFKITQFSATGLSEPARIETVTVLADFSTGALKAIPHWGHRSGGNTILLQMTEAADTVNEGFVLETGVDASYESLEAGVVTLGADLDIATSFTDYDPYGQIGNDLLPIYTSGVLNIAAGVMGQQTGASVVAVTGQRVFSTIAGNGVEVQGHTGDGLQFLLEVSHGSMTVRHGSVEHTFYEGDYWTPHLVDLHFGGVADLEFVCGANSMFTVGQFKLYTSTTDSDTITGGHGGAGFAASCNVTMHELGTTGRVLSQLSGNSGWELGVAPGGLPYVVVGDGAGTDRLTGQWPVRVGERNNLALNHRIFGDHTGLQVFVNGEVCGDKVTTIATVDPGSSDVTIAGDLACTIEDVAIYEESLDARDYSLDLGFSPPVFQVETSPPPGSDNTVLLRFYEDAGAVADDSGKDHHAYFPTANRRGIFRDRKLNLTRSTALWGPGEIQVLHTDDFTQALPQGLYVEGQFFPGTATGTLYRKWNAAETVGWKVEILTNGTIMVTVKDGVTTHTQTSTYAFADGYRRSLYVEVTSAGTLIRIDAIEETSAVVLTTLAAATEPAKFGPGVYGYLRTVILRRATLSQDEYDRWRDWNLSKWTPSDTVEVDGVPIATAQVYHFGPDRKYVVMPSGEPGYSTITSESNGVTLVIDRPYKYTYGYDREIPLERIENQVCSTKSPFRVLNQVPDGSVNLAYVQGIDITVQRNVSLIDLSHRELENLSIYHGGEFMITGAETGEGYIYTGQIDTEDILISNRSAMYRHKTNPTPLFHRYLVGRGRFYVYQQNALSVADIQVIRSGLNLVDGRGRPLSYDDFPWDIEVSATDVYGNALPDNVFAVSIYTNRAFLPGLSVQVQYVAADSLHDWRKIPSYLEIVNTTPYFTESETTGSLEADEYALTTFEGE